MYMLCHRSYVLFVVEKEEVNIYDIRPIEFLLWKKYVRLTFLIMTKNVYIMSYRFQIPVICNSLLEVSERGWLGSKRELIVYVMQLHFIYIHVFCSYSLKCKVCLTKILCLD